MSSDAAWPQVNAPETTSPALGQLFVPRRTSSHSPIDEYYSRATDMLSRSTREDVKDDEVLLGLILLGVFGAAELYFRRVLVGVVNVCPVARRTADSRTISFGAVGYYERESLALALFEGQSLAGSGEVRRLTESITGIAIPQHSSVWTALEEFEQICQIRHAASHACGELGSRNVACLRVSAQGVQCVSLDLLKLQGLVARTHNAVRAYNAFMFSAILGRWRSNHLLAERWTDDKRLFVPLHTLFYSHEDEVGEGDPERAYAGVAAAMGRKQSK